MATKQYTAPDTEVFEVRLEENFVYTINSTNTNSDNNQKPLDGGEEDF